MRLDGKIILITGGSRGIGKSIAELFTKEGAKVIITSKNETALKKTAKELGNIFYVKGDITKKIDVNNVVKKIIKKFGRIDVLINNAGVFPKFKKLHNISENEWKEVIDVNLNGQYRFTKAVIPFMMKNGGSIINMSSDAGLRSFENFYADAYTASKAALVMLTKAWAVEYARNKIRVNCVCAAVVETDMTNKLWLNSSDKRKKAVLQHPLGRIGTGTDIANAIMYFASDDSSWTTGSVLVVDGGASLK